MKRPSFQFYPFDWSGNSNLRRCSHEEKGIWIDVLCVLHDQEEYGVCRWPLEDIADAVGCTLAKLRRIVAKGVLKGADVGQTCAAFIYVPRSGRKNGPPVELLPEQPGPVWFSSRMVEDEHKRLVRGGTDDAPKDPPKPSPKGGMGAAPKDPPKPTPDPPPSRARPSSPSSPTDEKNSVPGGTGGGPPGPPDPVPVEPDKTPPTTAEVIFGRGLPMLLAAGVAEKSARSFLGLLRKENSDDDVIAAIQACADAEALQPVSYLQGVLKSARNVSARPTMNRAEERVTWMRGLWADSPTEKFMGVIDAESGRPV